MAAGAAAQPRRRQTRLLRHSIHCFFSRAVTMYFRKLRSLRISPTVLPFANSAPVGHTCTHFPQLVQVSESPQGSPRSEITREFVPRPQHVPGVRAFHFVAHADAARAQDAAVVVEAETFVADIHGQRRKLVAEAYVIDAELRGQILQLAVAVHHADRADVVALGEQQFDDQLALRVQLRRVGVHHHAFFHLRQARSLQFLLALDLHQAEPAGADVGKSADVAEPRNVDAVVPRPR